MRNLLFSFVFLTESLSALCQSTFIAHMDSAQAGYPANGRSVCVSDSGLVVFGIQISDDGTGLTRCAVYKLHPDGTFKSSYEIGTGEPYYSSFGMFDPVVRRADSGFNALIQRYALYASQIELVRFDQDGSLEQGVAVMTLPAEDSMIIGIRQLRATSDGGFIFCGFRDPPDAYASAILVKLDSTGSFQWEQDYSTSGQAYEAISVAQYADGGYVLAGYRLPANLNGLGFLIRTDSMGNQIWRRHFGERAGANGAVRVAADGTIVTFSSYAESGWPFGWQQYLVTKWDVNGSIVWQTRSHYFYQVTAYDLEILPDQSIVTIGTYSWLAELAKYSASGDSLWSRHLSVFNTLGNHLSNDVELTSDGGFLITGGAQQGIGDPTPNMQTIYVIKTDSLGCVVPGCQNVGVQEYVMDLQNLLRVSPNPASELVSVSLDLPEGGELEGRARAQLLDATGRLVLEQIVQQNLNQLRATLDVSALPAGTYYLHVRDAKRWLAGSKLVVE